MIEQLIRIAVIQGITEFLPISSSGHLNLIHGVGDYPDQGLAMDVAVHIGTLVAVFIYNRAEVYRMTESFLTIGRYSREYFPVSVAAFFGTLPVLAAGYWLNGEGELIAMLRSIEVIAWATLIFGILLGISDRMHGRRRFLTINLGDGLIIGMAQILALIPGTSRAGITMTAARAAGLGRRAAARFSMILSIPVILGSGVLKGADMLESGSLDQWVEMLIAALLAMVVALMAIKAMMAIIERIGFMPFVIYRVILGATLLGVIYL